MNVKSEHVVVVGAGHAGGALCGFLRQYGFEGGITMVGAEIHAPYQRPPLSKAWLKGEVDTSALLLKKPEWYAESAISLRLGASVSKIDVAASTAILSDGALLPYSQLVLATGACARTISLPGAELDGVVYLRDIAGGHKLRAQLSKASRIAIIGGGYVGLEVAATARHLGVEVVVLERESRLLSRTASGQIAQHLMGLHQSHGVTFMFGAGIQEIEGRDGCVSAIKLAGGERVLCDAVLIGIGAIPNAELATNIGLDAKDGIAVDLDGRTAIPNLFAIGDVTKRPLAHYSGVFRLESVPSALEQAKRVACSIAGKPPLEHELPWFWSDQYDAKLQIAGLLGSSEETVVRGDVSVGKFAVFHLHGGRVIAAECVNSPGDFLAAKKAIANGASPDPDKLRNVTLKVGDALSSQREQLIPQS